MQFDEAVKYVREKKGYSQEQLARMLNVSFATINRWENGKTIPRPMAVDAFLVFCERNNIHITISKGAK